jgi:branched-subunit amino acid permease
MHIAQLFVLFAGIVTAVGLFHTIKEFIEETIKELKDEK